MEGYAKSQDAFCPPQDSGLRRDPDEACLCSACILLTHDENGVSQPGLMLDLRKWKEHAANDALRAEEEDHLMYSALMASVSNANPRHDALASRPRDLLTEAASARRGGSSGSFEVRVAIKAWDGFTQFLHSVRLLALPPTTRPHLHPNPHP